MKKIESVLKNLTLQKQLVFVMFVALMIAAVSFLVFLPQILKPFYEQNIYEYLEQPANFLDINENKINSDLAYIIKTKSGAVYVSKNLEDLFGEGVIAKDILSSVTKNYGKFRYNKEVYYYYAVNGGNSLNVVFTDGSIIDTQEDNLITIILPTMVTTTLIVMILIFAWSNNVVYKIKRLKYKTENITSDKFKEGQHFTIDDELNMLSKSIDQTRKDLREKEEYKNYMFQNMSHELKTPIAVIDSYIEAVKDGVVSGEEGLKVVEEQTNKLKDQVQTMLYFNKIDYMKEQTEFLTQKVDMKEVVAKSMEKHKMQRQDVQFVAVSKAKDTSFVGTEDMWQTVLDNILGNFVRYAKSRIVITIKKDRLECFNDGEAIAIDVMDKIFSPYTKGKQGQTGLGLSIVKRITEVFGYLVTVTNVQDGVLFTVEKVNDKKKYKTHKQQENI